MTTRDLHPLARKNQDTQTAQRSSARLSVRGKFLYLGDQKLCLRGVTYGTFAPDENGDQYGTQQTVYADFTAMAESGINCVRTYTVPPRWLLDIAQDHDLKVMVGLPWEQHITFLDDGKRLESIYQRVREGVRACADHPALACFAVGNEIPASIVRWYGRKRCEQHLKRLCEVVKSEDQQALVTYVNYPTTEYLDLPFLDLTCFNVFLEARQDFAAYLSRLQNVAADKPLVITEIGLDSMRNGEQKQAEALAWQLEAAFQGGCAGAFVFSWTDEWSRGGHEIEDWDFGLTRRDRTPKPALEAVQKAFANAPHPREQDWPRISVVVCSYNGSQTIGETLEHVVALDYPNFETIVVDDGSKDNVPEIATRIGVDQLIRVENGGLSRARNLGLHAATGEIVAYIDDDAYPDPHWLQHLAHTFTTTDFAAVGGPNLPPSGDGWIADCVANSPGGPTHVLLSDREAEHIPGCNMAFRKDKLSAIGGFDAQFTVAGDDVDVCWGLQKCGWKLGFNPAAVVWHHRRNSVGAYWKQQKGYGKAEALLERKWPEKYNIAGHLSWQGRLYGNGHSWALMRSGRVYQGVWGCAPFQPRDRKTPSMLQYLPLMPEWVLVVAALAALSALGIVWKPLLAALPLFAIAAGVPFMHAILSARRTPVSPEATTPWQRFRRGSVIVLMHVFQPVARLWGRLHHGITPWRMRGGLQYAIPRPRKFSVWSEHWRSQEAWLTSIESTMKQSNMPTVRGGDYDEWDLEGCGGLFGGARLRMALEEHGDGRQMARFQIRPNTSALATTLVCLFGGLVVLAVLSQAGIVAIVLSLTTLLIAFGTLDQCGAGLGSCLYALAVEEMSEFAALEKERYVAKAAEEAKETPAWATARAARKARSVDPDRDLHSAPGWAIPDLLAATRAVREGRSS